MCFICDLTKMANREPELIICICGMCGSMILGLPEMMNLHENWHREQGTRSLIEWIRKAEEN